MMKQIDTEKLVAKIIEDYGISRKAALEKAAWIEQECPKVLMQNVEEWIEGKEFTEICIENHSIPLILFLWHNRDFLEAHAVMKELEDGEITKAKEKIWLFRM